MRSDGLAVIVPVDNDHPLQEKPKEVKILLEKFKILCCRFYLEAGKDGLVLPALKSALFFDEQFKDILRQQVCKYFEKKCADCILKNDCTYAYLYEERAETSWSLRRFSSLPIPLIWQPPLEKKTDYFPGENVVFNLVLCGRGVSFLKYLVDTVLQLSEEGLKSGSGSFEVSRITLENPFADYQADLLETTAENISEKHVMIKGSDIENWASRYKQFTRLSIRFLTPLLIKEDDEYLKEPSFDVIMKVLFQRATALYYFYHQQQEMVINYNEFKEQSKRIQKVKDQTRFVSAGQSTQKARIIPGLLGEAVYMGDFQLFLPLLKLGEWIHLGEQAMYGQGRIQVKVG